jgi:hypothetical protein
VICVPVDTTFNLLSTDNPLSPVWINISLLLLDPDRYTKKLLPNKSSKSVKDKYLEDGLTVNKDLFDVFTEKEPVIWVPADVFNCNNPVLKSPLINGVAVLLLAIYNVFEFVSLYPAWYPINTFDDPVIFVKPAVYPTTVLLFPVVIAANVPPPTDIFLRPVVLLVKARYPIAVLLVPLVFAFKALSPTAILFVPEDDDKAFDPKDVDLSVLFILAKFTLSLVIENIVELFTSTEAVTGVVLTGAFSLVAYK